MDFETFCLLQQDRVKHFQCSGGHSVGVWRGSWTQPRTSLARQVEMKQCRVVEERVLRAARLGTEAERLPRERIKKGMNYGH